MATLATDSAPVDMKALQQRLQEDHISKIKVAGVDIDGILRGKYISLDKFASAAEDGFGFCDVIFGWDSNDVLYDNGRYTGWHTGYPDTAARIDLSTYRHIPWEKGTAFFLVDFLDRQGNPLSISPRQLLQRVIKKSVEMGYEPIMAAEYEFFIFKETSETIRDKRYNDMVPFTPGMFGYSVLRTGSNAELSHEMIETMHAFDVPLEGFHTETGPGVYEAAIRYGGALDSADKAALFKTVAKTIAARNGLTATFMAKWNVNLPGCGGHVHQSLIGQDGKNVFYDGGQPNGISREMQQYMAGQLQLMPELTALICPTINSYKRLVPGTWAPTSATWGIENRTTALRAIPGSSKSTRVEYRLAGADADPYLAMAAALASGLYGIEKGLDLRPVVTGSGYEDTGALPLPNTLEKATRLLSESQVARDLLGEEFVDHFVRTRDWEVRQYHKAVTDWERERYFEII